MAKQPKRTTSLRQIRLCSGLSQNAFAKLLGINAHLYHSMELGRASVTVENAGRIFDHTGAAPSSLGKAIARAADGNPYSQKAWQAWRKYLGKAHLHWTQTTHLMNWTHFLCDIARKRGRLRLLQRALARALKDIAVECGLERTIVDELREIKMRMRLPFTYGTLRNSKLLAKAVGFRDKNPKSSDDAIWEDVVTSAVCWDPFGWCPPQVTKRLQPLE